MRVLMISKACTIGAYQKKLEELARFPDLELFVIVPPYWRDGRSRLLLEREHVSGYQLLVEWMALNGHFHLHFYPFLGRRMCSIQPDIVHMDEEPYNLATWQAMLLAGHCGAKKLFFTWQNLRRSYPFPFSAWERYNLTRADYALAGNADAAQVLRAKGYKGPLEIIPQFGVDPEIYRPLPDERVAPAAGRFVIGYMGRLVPEKGVDILLQAAARLDGDWELKIIGDGPQQAPLQALAERLGVSSRVSFQQRVPSSQVPTCLNRLNVLVLPSLARPNWKEQFGRVLVEAMACETPVIGSDSGEIPHVIGEAGLVFQEGDAEALRDCLARVRSDPEAWSRWGVAGRRRVLALYTQARIAALTYEVYRKM